MTIIKNEKNPALASEEREWLFGYRDVRRLPDGTLAGLFDLMFTTAICTDLHPGGYTYRWCFKDEQKAVEQLDSLEEWDQELEGYVARRT